MARYQSDIDDLKWVIVLAAVLALLFLAVIPTTCNGLHLSGRPYAFLCSIYPSTTTTTSIKTSTSSSVVTTTSSSSTTTIIYHGSCTPLSGFACTNATLSQQGTLSISIEQNIVPVMYHIQVGCGSSAQASGAPSAQWTNESFDMYKGFFQQFSNLQCTGAQNGTFGGYLWVNYTKLSYPPSSTSNPYYENEVASVAIHP